MKFADLVRARHSTRRFTDRPIEREKLTACLEAARLAPSACNSQPWHFVVVDEPELRTRLARETFAPLITLNRFVPQATALVAVVSERMKVTASIGALLKDKQYSLIDIGIAVEHFCLQACELGLGTCILGWFDEAAAKRLLGVPKKKRIELLIAVGYPDPAAGGQAGRKSLDEIASWNEYRS